MLDDALWGSRDEHVKSFTTFPCALTTFLFTQGTMVGFDTFGASSCHIITQIINPLWPDILNSNPKPTLNLARNPNPDHT